MIIVSGYKAPKEWWATTGRSGQDVKFLPKPYDFSTLAAAVRECLDRLAFGMLEGPRGRNFFVMGCVGSSRSWTRGFVTRADYEP
ncbi:MAG: hypothetical protein IPG04_17510 [Polyangiaceae bacterium]|nr:hypothetical protein [Polyangiaceae bacterium]